MAKIDLKPCICGGEAVLIHHLNSHFEMCWGVECQTCKEAEDDYTTPGYAIEAWNNRKRDEK